MEGGAQISDRHANFIVNLGGAKAADVVALIALARRTVLEKTGIQLQPEVRLVGDFDPELPPELQPHQFRPVLVSIQAFELPDPNKSCLRGEARRSRGWGWRRCAPRRRSAIAPPVG